MWLKWWIITILKVNFMHFEYVPVYFFKVNVWNILLSLRFKIDTYLIKYFRIAVSLVYKFILNFASRYFLRFAFFREVK